jgi:salicylate hydroxylase
VKRTRLQAALISKVPPGIIQLNKKLVSIHDAGTQGVHLTFEDGAETIADLVVGGDGIRSVSSSILYFRIPRLETSQLLKSGKVVRTSLFPEHITKFTGMNR